MSKFGTQIADGTMYEVKSPHKALELIEKVIEQYFGEYWTQHKPRCPLCDTALEDTERHMNRPVGECVNPKCEATIHISDFMGKMKDILDEWNIAKPNWIKLMQSGSKTTTTPTPATSQKKSWAGQTPLKSVDETIHIW